MFIDDIQAMQERREPLKKLTSPDGVAPPPDDREYEDLRAQLKLLDKTCPRYDVHNIFSVLFPKSIEADTPAAARRNAEASEKRRDLVKIAGKAPCGPPWFTFCVEHRHGQQQRNGYLIRWDQENRKYICTSMFDSVRVQGMIEFNPNAFEILLGDDDMFGGYDFNKELDGVNLYSAKQGAEVVRTTIELLNWDRDDVPTQTLVNPKTTKRAVSGGNQGKKAKRDPTIIKFEPFLRAMRAGTHRGGTSTGNHAPASQHLVIGHYINVTYAHPLFGHKPVLGRTYGRLWIRPHKRGNPQFGAAKAPRGVVVIGDVTDPAASQSVIPFLPSKKTGSEDR
jgi:hypothetical protein